MKFPWWWGIACLGVQLCIIAFQLGWQRRADKRHRFVMKWLDTLSEAADALGKADRLISLRKDVTHLLVLSEIRRQRWQLYHLIKGTLDAADDKAPGEHRPVAHALMRALRAVSRKVRSTVHKVDEHE